MKFKLGKRTIITLIAIVVAVSLIVSSFLILNSPSYAGKVESITFANVPNEVNSLIYIADNQQFFVANGLNVSYKNYASGLAAANGVLNGQVDIAAASEFVLVGKALSNVNISTFGSIDKVINEYVVARTDLGINNISDLKGKKIGVSLGTSTEFYIGSFLELNGIDISQVTLVNVPPPQTPAALANGTVDAVIAWQPNINTIENLLGNRVVMWPAQSNQAYYVNAICTSNWAVTHPELITRFLKSINQAESYLINNPNNAKAIVANSLNYSAAYVDSIWSSHQFALSLNQPLVSAMENEARWLISNNRTSETVVPNFLNYIYFDGLQTVKPESVNIIH
ncbi:MAG: NrtA/SsuA/CpmA family ABC transporter substrate-binding protein [Candidatus Bathyarchaeota archaeon]|nr:NrtA/SsuA/CpmA family ABC transporter substrate-binding protein [Candidatus Bathyarchaeota archaeon]